MRANLTKTEVGIIGIPGNHQNDTLFFTKSVSNHWNSMEFNGIGKNVYFYFIIAKMVSGVKRFTQLTPFCRCRSGNHERSQSTPVQSHCLTSHLPRPWKCGTITFSSEWGRYHELKPDLLSISTLHPHGSWWQRTRAVRASIARGVEHWKVKGR